MERCLSAVLGVQITAALNASGMDAWTPRTMHANKGEVDPSALAL
jgi:hypothetical protein